MQSKLEAINVVRLPHQFETVGHPFRIAILAAGTDLGATGQRVPSRFGPFDGGFGTHFFTLEDMLCDSHCNGPSSSSEKVSHHLRT